MKRLFLTLSYLLLLPLLAVFTVPPSVHAEVSNCPAVVSIDPDPPYTGTKFFVNVSNLRRDQSYSVGISDKDVGFLGFNQIAPGTVVSQDNTSGNPYRNGQSAGNQTTLSFGPFNPNGSWGLDPNKTYEFTAYQIGGNTANPCGQTLVRKFQSGKSPVEPIDPYAGATSNPSASFSNSGLRVDHCIFRGKDQPGVTTSLGCIPTEAGALANVIFGFALGIGGALAILFIILGGLKVATSQGNPDNLEEGRDQITKAIAGLVFMLLATAILGIIGIDILGFDFFHRSGGSINISP